jgi:two-component system, LytTR family, response regulator
MPKLKAIIVDDESKARELLHNLLKEYCPDVDVLDLCADLPNAVKAIRKTKPDVVFLDIEMPGHSGLELLDFFNEDEIDFSIVFTTAYNQYAIDAIKLSAFDYILKPIEPEELEKSVQRLLKKAEQKKSDAVSVVNDKIAVPTSNGLKFIDTEHIIYLKADNTYTEIYTTDGNRLIVSRTLKNFEDTFSTTPNFFRCNKSYIVNVKFVTDYVKSDGGYLILNNKTNIPIASDKVGDFLELSAIVKRN